MSPTRILSACVVVAAALALWGRAAGSPTVPDQPAADDATASVTAIDPVHDLVSIESAVALWSERADAQPTDYFSRTSLGWALVAQARETAALDIYERAEAVFADALSINPSHDPAHLGMASALHSQHRFAEALDRATAVLADDPDDLTALALVADARFELGQYDAADAGYRDLAAAERSAPAVSRLARLASIRGDNAGAVILAAEALELSQALALRPASAAQYWFQLGHYRFVAGDNAGAIDALTEATTVSPGHPGATEKLVGVLAAVGRTAEAITLLETLLADGPAPDLWGLHADLLRLSGRPLEAAASDAAGLDLARETIDDYPAERRHLVDFFIDRDPATALDLAEADFAERRDVGAYETLAWALHANGRSGEATPLIDQALAIGTREPTLLYKAAVIAAATGDVTRGQALAAEALSINPHFDVFDAPAAVVLAAG